MHYYSDKEGEISDLGFLLLENIGHQLNMDFRQFSSFVIALQLLLYLAVFIKFKVNPSVALIIHVIINYVQIANQLRYFLAFPLFLLALYYFFIEKRKHVSIILGVISFSLHSGIITMFTFLPFFYLIKNKKTIKSLLLNSFFIGVVLLLLFSVFSAILINIDIKYATYTEVQASTLGLLFILVYPTICIFILFKFLKMSKHKIINPIIKLSVLISLFSIVWMVTSCSGFQVINARYVNSFFPIWLITCMLLLDQNIQSVYKRRMFIFIFAVSAILAKYILPLVVFGHSDFEKIQIIWLSKFL